MVPTTQQNIRKDTKRPPHNIRYVENIKWGFHQITEKVKSIKSAHHTTTGEDHKEGYSPNNRKVKSIKKGAHHTTAGEDNKEGYSPNNRKGEEH